MKPDLRTCDHERGRSKLRICDVVGRVVEVRGVAWEALFVTVRGTERESSARVLAMGACAAVGVPLCHISRAFKRSWATVYSAEMNCSRRYRNSSAFRAEWDKIVQQNHEKND